MWLKTKFSRKNIQVGLMCLFALVSFCVVEVHSTGRDLFSDQVVVWVFDVGQGDAIFINAPDKQVLIDGGPSDLVLEKLGAVMPFWDRSIDLVVNTHPHADHVSGLISVLECYDVGEVWLSAAGYETGEYFEFLADAQDERSPQAGESISLGDGALLRVIYAPSSAVGTYFADPNDASVVLELIDGETTILLTGDAGVEQEDVFINSLGHIDILKVGHHGSDTATGHKLLDKISPDIGIISVGLDNDYGHPDPLILDRLSRAGVRMFRTDLDHDVRIKTDGHEPEIKLFDL